jgi:2-oxoglutaroyl-CoA hydrolase
VTGTTFSVERDAGRGIARITIGAPEQLNILTHANRFELAKAIIDLGAEPWLRVLVIDSASARAFSAGVDIGEFAGLTPLETSRLHEPMSAPARIRQPVIAAIDGHCYGGPFELCLACDFRVVTDRCQLGLPEVGLGQMPGSGGGQRLLRLVGPTRATMMCMTGLKIDGKTAESWGIASRCVPPSGLASAVDELAARLAELAPSAVQMIKLALNAGAGAPLEAALELEGRMYATLRTTEDYAEGLASWREKRPPSFRGR